MPIFNLICRKCKATSRSMRDSIEKVNRSCACGGKLKRNPSPPSTQVKETLDNGLMPKSVERLVNAEQLNRERAANGPRRE